MATIARTVSMQHASTMSTTSSASSGGPVKPFVSAPVATLHEHDPASQPVRKLTAADLPRALNCLTAAFATDSVARYFTHGLPDMSHWPETRRWKLHMRVMKYILKAHLLRGHVVGIGAPTPSSGPGSQRHCFLPADPAHPSPAEALDAVALFMPPGANMDDMATVVRSGIWRLHVHLSSEGRRRFFGEFFPLLHETKLAVLGSADADAAAWYLVYLGARPGARGKGCAGRLVRSVTEDLCDRDARECYLESSAKANVKLYRRLGFEVKETIALKRDELGGDVEMDIMVRKPATKKADNGADDDKANPGEAAP